MSDVEMPNHVRELIEKSRANLAAGQLQDAALSLREASALEPENAVVKAAWDALKAHQDENNIANLCKSYIDSKDETIVQKVIDAAGQSYFSVQAASESFRLLLLHDELDPSGRIKIITAISANTNGAKGLANMLHDRPSDTFGDLWTLGDGSVDVLVRISLTEEAWHSEEDRTEAIKGLFLLLVAKLLNPNVQQHETALRSVARLMASSMPALVPLIDNRNLAVLLSFLNVERPVALKSQATLAIAKFLEASPASGKSMLKDYVISHFRKTAADDVVAAISVAGAVFPIIPDMVAAFFLTPEFAEDLKRMVTKSTDYRLREAALELLSAACIDKSCRERIQKICAPFLEDILESSPGDHDTAMAGLILSKIRQERLEDSSRSDRDRYIQNGLVSMFKKMMMNSGEREIQTSFEGLAYSSIRTDVKEQLANDQAFLKHMIKVLTDSPKQGPLLFGGLTILSNITAYTPILTAEEKRIAQLQAYASQSNFAEPSPMDDEKYVTARCKKVLDAGVATVLVKSARQASPVALNLIASVLLSLSHERVHCGIMAQQGLPDIILQLAHLDQVDAAGILPHARRQSAHALARILIAVPPELFFARTQRTVQKCIGPLNFLVSHLEPQDPHCAFDALRALTNIAGFNEASARLVSDNCFASIAVYLQASRSAQQQAATECVCNLSHSNYFLLSHYVFGPDEGDPYEGDFDMDHPSANRKEVQFQRLILLTNGKARGTRIAAMGALAITTGMEYGRKMLIRAPDGLENIMAAFSEAQTVEAGEALGLTGEEAYTGDVEMRLRAACAIHEVCCYTVELELHRRLVRHGLMKLINEGAKHLPTDENAREQLLGYTEPIVSKLKEAFKK